MPQILEVRFGSNPALTGTNASYLRYVLRWAEPAKPAVHLERPSASIPAAFGISAQIRPLLASNSATRHWKPASTLHGQARPILSAPRKATQLSLDYQGERTEDDGKGL